MLDFGNVKTTTAEQASKIPFWKGSKNVRFSINSLLKKIKFSGLPRGPPRIEFLCCVVSEKAKKYDNPLTDLVLLIIAEQKLKENKNDI